MSTRERLNSDPDIRDLLAAHQDNAYLREINKWLFYSCVLLFVALVVVGQKLFNVLESAK